MRTLVTGPSGFVGKAVLRRLVTNPSHQVVAAFRNPPAVVPRGIESFHVGDLLPDTDWTSTLQRVDTVIHLAARVHVMVDASQNPLTEYRRVNVEGTRRLAQQAASAGTRRFVFVSSIKVNGESTSDSPFRPDDIPQPQDPYAISKHEAERAIFEIGKASGMEVVVIRPPLVYGPGVRANFLNMMRWITRGVPLPLGAIHNRRSLVALDNLADLLVTSIHHPAAANETFLAADGEDLSTTELLARLSNAMEHPCRLIPVPQNILKILLSLVGKRNIAHRLCDSLQVDISKARNLLGWKPPVGVDEGLRTTAHWFTSHQ